MVERIYGTCIPGIGHAVVITPLPDGSASFYDPQNGKTGILPKGSYTDWNY